MLVRNGKTTKFSIHETNNFPETTKINESTVVHINKSFKNNFLYFLEWCLETSGDEVNFENVDQKNLNEKLRHFYAEAKPKNTEKRLKSMSIEHANVYHKNSLKNVRAALNRHIKDMGRDFDIVKDTAFRSSNVILDSTLKMMVASGLSRPTQHKRIIESDDLQSISAYIYADVKDPVRLRLKVWYILAIHNVSRGLEFHHQLNLNSFDFKTDVDGDEFAVINHETQQKNIQGGITSEEAPSDKHMYADKQNPKYCPIIALKELIEKTDPNAKSLFNRCVKDIDVNSHSIWYTKQSLAKRTYSGFMRDLCKNAKCKNEYTAHCFRATAIQCLNDAGHELRHIMYMTGHKNEASIRSYNRHCSVQQKKSLSTTLAKVATGRQDHDAPTSFTVSRCPTTSTSVVTCPGVSAAGPVVAQSNANMSSVLNSAGILNNSMFTGCTFNITLPSGDGDH